EDRNLKRLYNKYGPSWVKIGEEFVSRSSKQCRERWLGYLAPNLKKGPFIEEEAAKTYQLYDCFGPQWAKIAEFLPGRTGNMVKNFYHNNQRQNRRIITESSSPLPKQEENSGFSSLNVTIRRAKSGNDWT
ncbi:13698_t:CDS:2, partial [Entrophospora sp. SA101]